MAAAVTAWELLSRPEYRTHISWGCAVLDRATGGLRRHGITELAGEAGVGKTQWALQLLIEALCDPLSPAGSVAVYIGTEGFVPTGRLMQLAAARQARGALAKDSSEGPRGDHEASAGDSAQAFARSITDRVLVSRAPSMSALDTTMTASLPALCQHRRVAAIAIDSVAAPFRGECSGARAMASRSEMLRRWAARLKALSDEHHCPVIVTNQVTASAAPQDPGRADTRSCAPELSVTPALGLVWAQCVTTRILLSRPDQLVGAACFGSPDSSPRQLHVAFSPSTPPATLRYAILAEGVRCDAPYHEADLHSSPSQLTQLAALTSGAASQGSSPSLAT